MPVAKKAATAAKKPGTAVAKWDEALAARAKIAQKAEASVSTGEWISVKGGQLTFKGNVCPGNKLDAVILASRLENQWYEGDYDANSPQSPSCYAFGTDEETMVPHEKSPNKQSDSCATCPHNEYGSADKGRGKACKNVRRVSLIPASALDDPGAIPDEQAAYLKVPVTSVKGWAGFVQGLSQLNRPPLAFVTEISTTPDAQTQFKVNFRAKESIEDGETIGALLTRADKAEGAIEFPYTPVDPDQQKAKGGRNSRVQRGSNKPAAKATGKAAAAPVAMPPARKTPAKAAAARR